MTEEQLLDEIKHYVSDNSYNYAIMIDGEWGSGKTYFIKTTGTQTIKNYEVTRTSPKEVGYISLYGCKNVEDIQERIIVKVLARISKIEKYKKKLPPAVTTLLVSSKSLAKGSLSLLPDLVIPMLLPGNSESVKKVFHSIFSKGNTTDAISKYLSIKILHRIGL